MAYAFRNNAMIKLTEDQVVDPFTDNSPITSYFGGKSDGLNLDFDTVLRNILAGDILLLASDGLLKSIPISLIENTFVYYLIVLKRFDKIFSNYNYFSFNIL